MIERFKIANYFNHLYDILDTGTEPIPDDLKQFEDLTDAERRAIYKSWREEIV